MNLAYKTLAAGALEPVVIRDKNLRGKGLSRSLVFHRTEIYLLAGSALLLMTMLAAFAHAREKNAMQYGAGLIVNIPLPEAEVAQVVEDVAQNGIIRGTKEYNKDEYIEGAVAATSTPVFAAWTEGGKVFYKVRKQALDPRNFKDSSDVGTLAVRYVVQPQGEKNTVLRIDALFVEDFRRSPHPSNGSVEGSEYKDIQDRLASVELMKKETAEALQAKQERLAKQNFGLGSDTVVLSSPPPGAKSGASTAGESANVEGSNVEKTTGQATPVSALPPSPASPTSAMTQPPDQPAESLEQRIAELRQQLERRVKKPGAPLKSAPFHTATTLKSLEPGAEVLILISTPYWYGVETHSGDHGWIRRDQLEQVP